MVLKFVSEEAAVDFVRFMADTYEIEAEIGAYLTMELDPGDFLSEEAVLELVEKVGNHGAEVLDVLL